MTGCRLLFPIAGDVRTQLLCSRCFCYNTQLHHCSPVTFVDTSLLLQALRDLSTGNSCAILSHFTQHHLDLQHASAKSSASKEVVTKFKSVLPADAAAYLSKQGWTLQQTADVVQECSKQDVALFGDLALTDAQVAEQSEYKVLLASRAL